MSGWLSGQVLSVQMAMFSSLISSHKMYLKADPVVDVRS